MLKTTAALLVAALASGAAAAQTIPAGTPPATATPAPATAPSSMPAGASQAFVTQQSVTEFRASKFIGLSVYGSDNQRIGDINEILIDERGSAQAAVIGVGGFLGIGEKNIAVPFTSLQWVNDPAPLAAAASAPAAPTATAPPPASTAPGLAAAPDLVTAPPPTVAATIAPASARSPAETAAYNGYPDHATLRVTKAEIQGAPTFRYYGQTQSNAAPAARRP